jgi:cytochrome c peroxidase
MSLYLTYGKHYSARWLRWVYALSLVSGLLMVACKDDEPPGSEFNPTPYVLEVPKGLPPPLIPDDNPLTVEGVSLGRMLFYDPILSADSSLSCAGCHNIDFSFVDDNNRFSIGIDGIAGSRNAMPIFNLAYVPSAEFGFTNASSFFWDGRAATLEEQALLPIEDPIEMHDILPNVLSKLQNHPEYPGLFFAAFGTEEITEELLAKAIAQFERTIVSGNSRFDRARRGEIFLTDDEQDGFELFNDLFGADCFHCHGENGGLFTDYSFKNNGLDEVYRYTDFADPGLGQFTGDTSDYGKFKVPTLRNVELTAPYMHDGRFETLEEVIDFYSDEVKDTPFTDQLMEYAFQGGAQLTEEEKDKLLAFLKSLTDTTLLNKEDYKNPFN